MMNPTAGIPAEQMNPGAASLLGQSPQSDLASSLGDLKELTQAADVIKAAAMRYGPEILDHLGLPGMERPEGMIMSEGNDSGPLGELFNELGEKAKGDIELPGIEVPNKGETVIEVEIEPKDVHDKEVAKGEEPAALDPMKMDDGTEGVDSAFERYINKKKLGIEE